MYNHILIAIDGSELATKSLEHGLALASALNARASIVTVTASWEVASKMWGAIELSYLDDEDPDRTPREVYERAMEQQASEILDAAKTYAEKHKATYEALHLQGDYPAPTIIKAVEDIGCDLVVMGSHGRRGIARFLMGSQANEVVSSAKIPVLIVR